VAASALGTDAGEGDFAPRCADARAGAPEGSGLADVRRGSARLGSACSEDAGPRWRRLPDGRLHAHHGPIDLIVLVAGPAAERVRCERAAHEAFAPVLAVLASELVELRRTLGPWVPRLHGPVARCMLAAVRPHASSRVTPMAAVAGAVADHVLEAMLAAGTPTRACVNNGGDIALHVAPGETLRTGVADLATGALSSDILVRGGDGIGGIATSGWRGRSHSLGIADAVTVIAATAAAADVAATLIANAVDLPGSDRVRRVAACELAPDSDLGARLVTVDVAALGRDERARALASGAALARRLVTDGRVLGARLELQSDVAVVAAEGGPVLDRGRQSGVGGRSDDVR